MFLIVCDSMATASLTSNNSLPELLRVIFLVDRIVSLPLLSVWIHGGDGGSSYCDCTSMSIKHRKKHVESAKSGDSTIEDDLKVWSLGSSKSTRLLSSDSS
ncbi:hypothetical protein NL676_030541 [Syzygium grande]|nr:hypothetical protein NL676_030541 [Syzygium grande]